MPSAPTTAQLWLTNNALGELLGWAELSYPLETGGILIGYRAAESIVVTHVVGPGPNAVHHRTRFVPDHDFHVTESARVFHESHGCSAYLGDWHTHPDGRPLLSALDRMTLESIACDERAQCSEPVMLLFAGKPGAWRWSIFQLKSLPIGRKTRGVTLALWDP